MSGFLLDTCTISKWFDKKRVDVDARVSSLGESNQLYVSAVSIGEFLCGQASQANTDVAAQSRFNAWLRDRFLDRIVDVTSGAAGEYGPLRALLLERYAPGGAWKNVKKRPERCLDVKGADLGIDENDLWLVAQAEAHNLTLVTMDRMTRITEVFGANVPIIYWPDDGTKPAECSPAAIALHGPTHCGPIYQ